MKLIDKYRGMVDRHYTMNPNTELLVPNAADLENGMKVLVAAVINRHEIMGKKESDFVNFDAVLMTNRWCTVKDIEVSGSVVEFVGVYPDGREIRRLCGRDTGWLVKRNSDEKTVPETSTKEKVHEAVREYIQELDDLNLYSFPAVDFFTENITKRVMKAIDGGKS